MSLEEFLGLVFDFTDILSLFIDIAFCIVISVVIYFYKKEIKQLDTAIISFKVNPYDCLDPAKYYQLRLLSDKIELSRRGTVKWNLPLSSLQSYEIKDNDTLILYTENKSFKFSFASRYRNSVHCFALWIDKVI